VKKSENSMKFGKSRNSISLDMTLFYHVITNLLVVSLYYLSFKVLLLLLKLYIQVRREQHRYLQEPELKEEGGTPAIVQSIRAGLVFQLKQSVTPAVILQREEYMLRYITNLLYHISISLLS
jgi:hypothetical protein